MKKIKFSKQLSKDIAKPEFWIGLMTTFVLISIVGWIGFGQWKNYQANRQQKQEIVSPTPTAVEDNKKIEITPTVTVAPKLAQIKKLADTSGEIIVVAQPNDTFWQISRRMCGDGRYFRTIESLNGYQNRHLQPGDIITIYCY